MARPLSDDEENELAAEVEQLADEIDNLATFLTGLKASISNAMDQVQMTVDNFDGDAANLIAEVHEMAAMAGAAASTIERAGAEASEALLALDALIDGAEDLTTPLFDLADEIAEAASSVRDDVDAFVDDWLSAQREALDAGVLELGAALDDSLVEPISQALDDVLSTLTEATDEAVAEALQPAADTLAETVDGLLDEIVDRLTEGDAETQGTNAALQPVIDALQPPIEALIDQVERVTPLASMVGMA